MSILLDLESYLIWILLLFNLPQLNGELLDFITHIGFVGSFIGLMVRQGPVYFGLICLGYPEGGLGGG